MKTPLALAALLSLSACGFSSADVPADDESAQLEGALKVPSEDRPETVDIGSWNVEWLGDVENGPTGEVRQRNNVARALKELDLDLVGLVEVVSEDAFHAVMAKLPDHDGLLVTDPRVEGGQAYYGADEQKVALIVRKRFTIESARVVVTDAAYDFAGRPPMEVKLRFTEGGRTRTLAVLVAHFKAMANHDGYQRRTAAAAALKTFLDTEYRSRWVLVVGDFNDNIDQSTYWGQVSPFAALANDPAYKFTTAELTAAQESTTVEFSATIDHHLASASLANRYVQGTAKVVHLERYISSYGTTTSDHYPVLTRYNLM